MTQEPVAWMSPDESSVALTKLHESWVPLYPMPSREWVGLDLSEMDQIIDGNIKITDQRLRDGVYGVVLDTVSTIMDKNDIKPWEEKNNG